MDELIGIIKYLKKIKEDILLKAKAWDLVRKIIKERKYREELIKEKEEMKKSINEINYLFAKERIPKDKVVKQWRNWLKYCEINNIDKWTGGLL